MASPTTRAQLIDHCKRRLGMPVIEINVADEQVEDCVDDAIQFFQEFHSDATVKAYIKHQITSTDVTNEYISLSNNVHYVNRVLPFAESSIGGGSGPWSLKYQIAMSDLQNGGSFFTDIQYYAQMSQYLETLDMMLTGAPLIEYQRHGNRLFIFGEWADNELKAGDWIVIEASIFVDPETQTSIYNNKFIKDYTTALIKNRWGQNMSKYEGVQLPGGVVISGERLLNESIAEKEQLEERMRSEYELPVDFYVG